MARFGLKLEVHLEVETPVGYQREEEVQREAADELRRAGVAASQQFSKVSGASVSNLRAEAELVGPLKHTATLATVKNGSGASVNFDAARYLAELPDDDFDGFVMTNLGPSTETDQLAQRAAQDHEDVKGVLIDGDFECSLDKEGFADFVRKERPHLIRMLLPFLDG